ncbi:MAG: hypothetical protein QMD85_03895, partial [Candidatus Aenigmarchaeota archaeon]|nr:hypothetical protein [Candidatus Aenigmarchaeota archaeon]MDI6722699.1 hypothetical protein [Candidatus Aenigmarchaeota archaeon]
MGILRYDQLDDNSQFRSLAYGIAYSDEFVRKLVYSSTLDSDIEINDRLFLSIKSTLGSQLRAIYRALEGDLSNKTILDLGYGSRGYVQDMIIKNYTFRPWLCRALHELGAHP